jgi:hypothetical protein
MAPPGNECLQESLSELQFLYRRDLEDYTRQLRLTTELLLAARDSETDMQRFVEQRESEHRAFERFRASRRRYLSALHTYEGQAARSGAPEAALRNRSK